MKYFKFFGRTMIRLFFTLCVFFSGLSQVQAKTYDACFKEAAKKHNIPIQWLYAISFTESSFNPKSKNKNRNGSRDYGLMQINSIWKKEAKRLGYSWHKIKTNPCTNVMFGGHILKSNLKRTKSLSKAIGAYNVGFANTPKAKRLRKKYYQKVSRNRHVAKKHLKRLKKRVRPV